jgi:hypothetical protein
VLHDGTLSDDPAGVITDVRLVQRVGNVATGGGEVGKIHHCDEVEVVVEVTGIISTRQRE